MNLRERQFVCIHWHSIYTVYVYCIVIVFANTQRQSEYCLVGTGSKTQYCIYCKLCMGGWGVKNYITQLLRSKRGRRKMKLKSPRLMSLVCQKSWADFVGDMVINGILWQERPHGALSSSISSAHMCCSLQPHVFSWWADEAHLALPPKWLCLFRDRKDAVESLCSSVSTSDRVLTK